MADSLALYLRLVGGQVRSQLEYRVSFVLLALSSAALSLLDFVVILVLFENVPALGGWSVGEVAFLYGVSGLSFALADMLIGHVDDLQPKVRDGSFDLLLVRPRGTLFQVATSDFELRRLGRAAQAAAVLGWALTRVDVRWDAANVAILTGMTVCGVVLYSAVWVAVSTVVFWTVEGAETSSAFTYGGQALTQYPIDVYAHWLQAFSVYVVPVAFAAYLPSLVVLGKDDPLGLPRAVELSFPLVAAAACVAAGLAWRFAVRRYRSAGG